jgi:hypothetical protein
MVGQDVAGMVGDAERRLVDEREHVGPARE